MKTQINHLLALTLCAFGLANAFPTAEEYPEVIPGPGLPSLASLNLTSAELYQRVPSPDIVKRLERRFNLICNQVPQCSVSDATACFNFLNALGHQACTVPDPFLSNILFCTAGGCNWGGTNFKEGGGLVSSFCSDVATGGAAVVFGCSQSNGLVSGSNAANGNGDLVVTITSQS
ncbi:hypothetical protein GGX14DRAFT_485149 [Mycena pura]|uniref:Uncharacterized protein n=1 Tax=Mycena pura TaxID=153505 RepID=A0AAD6XZ22_9AGAR|nr:hypothetical protein GGX14DRAFT_485149 [Mycena pura]